MECLCNMYFTCNKCGEVLYYPDGWKDTIFCSHCSPRDGIENSRDVRESTQEEIEQYEQEMEEYTRRKSIEKTYNSMCNKNIYTPKCPVCGSPNIHKISVTKRVVSGAAFGLFSKTARSQWECSNCGNKW